MAKLIAGVRSGANGFYHTREITLRKALFASTALVGIVMANPAQAADHQVGSSADLSSAITASNLTSGDTITLTADVTLSDLMPVIRSGVSVIGNGHTISGANTYRIFFVDAGAAAVSFNDVVVANGLAQGGNGAAGGGGGMGAGGAVFVNSGAVTANNVSFSGDNAKGGAAIANSGPRSGGGGGGLGGSGGGSSFGGGGGGGYSGGGGGGGGTTQNSIDTGNAAGGAGQGGAGGNGTSSAGSGTAGANGGGAGGTGTGSVTFSFGGGGGGGAANGGAGGNSSGGGGGGAGLTGLGGTGGNSGGSSTAGGIGGGGGGSASGSTAGGATGGDFGGGGGAGASFSVTGGQGGYGGGGGGSAYTNGGIGGFGGGGGNGVAGGAGGGAGTAAGGGGAGLGGAVFVRSGTGASFAITTTNSTSNVVGGTAIGGTSTNGKGGTGAGAGLLLASGTTTGISVSAGNTTTINGIADDSATSLTGANGTTAGTGTGAAVSVSGGGTLVLTGSNTYAGQTTVNGSTLRVGNGTTNGTLSSAVVMSGGSNLTFNDTTAQTYASPISGAGSVSTIGAGAVTLSGAGSWTGVTTIGTGATLIGTTATIAGSNIANGGSLVYDQGTDGNAGRVISGVGSLTKQGTGSVTLATGTNYTGGTNVQGGRLVVVNQSAPSGTTAISTGATFEDNVNSGTLYLDGTTFTGAGTFVKSGNGTLASRGLFAMAAGSLIDVQAGRLVGSSDNQGRFTGNLASLNVASGATFSTSEATVQIDKLTGAGLVEIGSPGSLTIGAAGGSGSFAGVISNQGPTAGTLTKIGAGTQTLTGVSTFTGTTTISAGTLALAGAGSIANSTIINNASFDISGHTGGISMATLTGAGATALGANTLTLTNANGTYSGVLSGTGGLTKQGAALYVLTGANTFTGTTSVTQGTLALGNGGAIGTLAGDVAVSGGAVLQINRSGTPTVANAFSGAGSVELVQSASLTGVVSTSGGVRIGSGQVGTLSNVQSSGNAVTLNVGSILVTNTGGVVASTGATGVTTQSSAGAIINSGTIVGLTGGINAATTIGTTTITNNGTIGVGTYSGGAYTFGGTGYGIAVTGSSSINNLGTIRGSGAAIFNDGALILVNTGAIRGGQGSAATQDAVYAVSANIVNGGSITTTDRLGTLAVPTYAAINLNAGSSTVTNGAAGILTGGSDAFYGNAVQSAGITTFNNYGSATGQGTASGFRQLANAASTINLFAGSTTGNIVTNAGNDTVSIFNGRGTTGLSEISGSGVVLQNAGTQAAASFGTIALGTGSNVVQLRGTGNGTAANGAAATIALNTLSGASFITKMDAGTWTLSGAASGATAAAIINAGVGGAPGSGGLLIFNGSGLTGAINVNGATIRAMSTNAFGTGTIFTFDPTVQFGATGTYTNAITVQSVDPVADPTILQTFGTNITATLSGAITQASGAAQPIVFSSVDATGTPNTGTFVLSNTTNNWAGVTTVSAGTTLRGTYQSISGGSITNSGILNYNQNTDGTATQAITGSGAFIKNGSGNLTLSGANGWTGVTTVSGGTLTGTSASIAGSSIVNNSALVYNQTGSGTVTQAISGNATVTVTGLTAGNTLTFNAALTNLGGISAVGSSVQINAGSTGGILESGTGARTLTIAGGTANNATNNFGGSGLYINGGTGPTTVNVASGATLSTTSGNGNRDGITALSTTIVTNRGTISSGFNAAIALAGGGSIDNFGTVTGGNGGNGYGIAVSNILAASVTLEASSIVSGGAGGVTFQTTGTGVDSTQFSNAGQISSARYGIDIGGPGSPFITNTATGTISGGLAGILRESGASDAVTINNSGAIVGTGGIAIDNQSGASTFTLTNLASGNIVGSTNGIRSTSATVITNSGVIASGTLAGGTSGALTVSGQSGITLSGGGSVSNLAGGVIRGATYGIDASGGATTISSNGEITGNNGTAIRTGTLADSVSLGANSVTNGIVSLGGGADTLTLSAGATGTGQLDGGAGTDAFILDGTGAGSIDISRVVNFESRTKNGTSGFTLTGTDVSTVGWTINGGSLLANTGSINAGAAVTVNANGTLGTLGNLTIASLSGAGTVALGANTLTLGGDNSSTSFSGIASGTGGFVKTGTGTFTISGANTYTGATDITAGTLRFGASDVLSDATDLTIRNGATLDLNGFSDTVGTFALFGTLTGGGLITANTTNLNGGTLGMALSSPTVNQVSGTTLVNGTIDANNLNITGGTLRLGANDRIGDGAAVTVNTAGTLDLQAFNDTVASLVSAGTINGSGTLTAATYELQGGTVNANLGTGSLTQTSGISTLNGASAASSVGVTGGTLLLGAAERLDDGATLTIDANGTLDLAGFQETVASASIGGTLDGTGTLNAATYALTGGTMNANLGAGTLTQVSGTSTLNGTSAATIVDVTGGTLLLGSAERLDDGAALTIDTSGTLDLAGFQETVASANIGGTLNGTGTLNAATYALTGGTVNANLGAGTLTQVSGTSTLNGTSAAAIVNVTGGTLLLGAAERLDDGAALTIDTNSTLDLAGFQETVGSASIGGTLNGTGTLNAATYALTGGTVNANLGAGTLTQVTGTSTLNGTSAAAVANVAGGTLVLGASERLDDAATLSVDTGGILDLAGFQETVGTAAIGGTLNGTGTLTAATYALNGATVNANLGTGTLTQVSGASTLNGTSLASQVNITGGTLLLGASERLDDGAALIIDTNGILDLAGFQETVASTNIGGVLNGTGTLNAATYALIGGTVNANLGTGTLTQTSGTSTLNGTSAASQVNVTGGTLLLGASERLADSAALSIDTNGVLDLAGFQETVASTSIEGTLNGTATLNAATYALSGGTVNANLGAGTLNQTSGTSTLNGTSSAALVNIVGGTLLLGASDRLSSAAALTVTAPGTFDLAGYNQTVAQLSGSGAIALGNGRLSVVQNTTTDFSGSISGSGGLSKASTGALSLSGTSTYTGATLVTGGLLSVNGVIASPVTVSGSGRLGGNGRVGGVTIASGATLAPGNSIGSLNINGNLTVASGAFYAVETSPTAADRVNVSGTATLQGGTVQVLASGTAYAPLTRYTILTAAGGVTGAFAGLTSNYTFLTPELEYAPTAVALVLRRNNVAFSSVVQTPNQLAVAVALQGVGASGLSDAILPLDAPGARQAFDALSGEIYASVPSALIAEGSKVRDALLLNGRRTGEGFGIWGDLVDSTGQFDANTNIGTAKLDTLNKGVLAGIDYGQGGFRGSVVGGYSEGTYSMGTRGSTARVESYHAGGQVGYTAGRFRAEVGGAYSWHDIYTKRSVAFTNFAESVKSSQNAHTVQGFGEVGYALFDGPTFRFEPFAGYTHIRASVDGTQETPGLSALTVSRVSRDVDYTTAGFHLTAKVPVGGAGTLFQPRLSVAWQHGWGDLAGTATSALAGTAPFTITGAVLAGDAVKIDSGFDLSFGAVRVGASYVATAGEHQQDHGAKVTIGVQF